MLSSIKWNDLSKVIYKYFILMLLYKWTWVWLTLAAFSLLLLSQNICVNFSSVTSCLNVKCTFPGAINCHYSSFRFQFLQAFTQMFMYFNHNQNPFSQRSVLSCFILFYLTLSMLHKSHYIISIAEVIIQIIPKPTNKGLY